MKKNSTYKTQFGKIKTLLIFNALHVRGNDYCFLFFYKLKHFTANRKYWFIARLIHAAFYGVLVINNFHDTNNYRKNNIPYSILMSEAL